VTRDVSRFAPSTTGQAHPGTLLSALLVWLDVRAASGHAVLRLEDLDHTRCTSEFADQLRAAVTWLGLDWDEVVVQSGRRRAHEAALDQLAAAGRLYPCRCGRSDRAGGRRAPDGGWAYAGTCRGRPLPPGGWRTATDNLRVQLDDERLDPGDEGGLDLGQTPALEMGDPIVRRRDGVIAYHLAVVVDDADAGVTRVVRGRDLATSTATQVALQRLLGLPTPRYRHHLLLLEPRPAAAAPVDPLAPAPKLAKLHGSIPFDPLSARHDARALVGLLAHGIGLRPTTAPCSPAELLPDFDWARVSRRDVVARWADGLVLEPTDGMP
jgi:glutamyl-Q tRNA(Asp) synthetase